MTLEIFTISHNCHNVLGNSQVYMSVDIVGASDYSRLAEDDCSTTGDTIELKH